MSTVTIGWKPLSETEKNTWLAQADSKNIVEMSDLGFNVGFFDGDGNNEKVEGENVSFFKEGVSGASVVTLGLTRNADGTFSVSVRLKGADGQLAAVAPTLLSGTQWEALRDTRLTLTVDSLAAVNQVFGDWRAALGSASIAPSGFSMDDNFFNGGSGQWQKYYGWTDRAIPTIEETYTYTTEIGRYSQKVTREGQRLVMDPSRDHVPREQGSANNTHGDFIGGWGGWVRHEFEPGRGWQQPKYHFVGAYAAYEMGLSGRTYTPSDIYAKKNQSDKFASTNGITIGKVTVTINGAAVETMGFSKTLNGYTYSFYWDQAAGCNRLGRVLDSTGKDVTAAVLAMQSTTTFGKSWSAISSSLVLATGTGASISAYGAGFTPENTSGSAEAPTASEIAAYNAFKADPRWSAYMDASGRITRLPIDPKERQALFAGLLPLNPAHILTLFTANDANHVDGLDLLMQLANSVEMTDANVMKLGEWFGKLMYLAGRGLAKNAGDEDKKSSVDFFTKLHKKLVGVTSELANISLAKGFGVTISEKIMFSFMLGLRNYTSADGDVSASMLTSEETLLYFVNKIASAADMSSAAYDSKNARSLIGCVKDVVLMLGHLNGLQEMNFGSSTLDYHASSSMIVGVYQQGAMQKLLALAFGALASSASQSTAAQDLFVNAQKTAHEESRKLEDALAALYIKLWDLMLEWTKAMLKN